MELINTGVFIFSIKIPHYISATLLFFLKINKAIEGKLNLIKYNSHSHKVAYINHFYQRTISGRMCKILGFSCLSRTGRRNPGTRPTYYRILCIFLLYILREVHLLQSHRYSPLKCNYCDTRDKSPSFLYLIFLSLAQHLVVLNRVL